MYRFYVLNCQVHVDFYILPTDLKVTSTTRRYLLITLWRWINALKLMIRVCNLYPSKQNLFKWPAVQVPLTHWNNRRNIICWNISWWFESCTTYTIVQIQTKQCRSYNITCLLKHRMRRLRVLESICTNCVYAKIVIIVENECRTLAWKEQIDNEKS